MSDFLIHMILLFFTISITAMNTNQHIELIPYCGRYFVKVLIKDSSIYVEDENATYRVPTNNQNQLLRDILKHKAIGKFIDGGYIRVDKTSSGKYFLSAKIPKDK